MLNFNHKHMQENPTSKVFENSDLLRYISSYITGEQILSKNNEAFRGDRTPTIPYFLPIRITFGAARELIPKENLYSRKEDYVSSISSVEWAIQMGCNYHENESLCRHAAASGNIDVIDWALKQNPPYTIGKETIKYAAKYGKLEVLRYLRKNVKNFSACLQKWNGANEVDCESFELDTDICSNAAYHGHFETLKWLKNHNPSCPWGVSTLYSAVASGHLDMVDWILEDYFFDQFVDENVEGKLYAIAAQFGHISILDLLYYNSFEIGQFSGYAAAANGHLLVLKWLRSKGYVFDENTFAAVVGARHEETIRWLFHENLFFILRHDFVEVQPCSQEELKSMCEFLLSGDHPCPVDDQVSYCAINTRNYDLLVWLKERVFCPWDIFCPALAIEQEDFELLKQITSATPSCPLTGVATTEAACKNNLEILQWLRSRDPPCPWDANCLDESLAYGLDIEVHLFLLREGCPWDMEMLVSMTESPFLDDEFKILKEFRIQDPHLQWDTRCWFGVAHWNLKYKNSAGIRKLLESKTLKMLNFLKSQGPLCPWDSSVCTEAAKSGNLFVLKWLTSQDPPCPIDSKDLIIKAAEGGKLKILKWIYSSMGIDYLVIGFLCLAYSNHMNVLEWLKEEDSLFRKLEPLKEVLIIIRDFRMSTEGEISGANNVEILQWMNENL